MTPEQCHAVHCNSQQVEGSAGWDRHSSGDLYNRQMDDQDEGSRRIYNQRDLTKRGTAIRKTPKSSSCAVLKGEKKNSSSDKARGRTLTLPPTMPLTILLPNDPVRPLTKSSQKPSSWAQFLSPLLYQIHCIGPVGFGFAHIYSERRPLNRDPTYTFESIFKMVPPLYLCEWTRGKKRK